MMHCLVPFGRASLSRHPDSDLLAGRGRLRFLVGSYSFGDDCDFDVVGGLRRGTGLASVPIHLIVPLPGFALPKRLVWSVVANLAWVGGRSAFLAEPGRYCG
jgi:hypothetical protein